MADPPVQLIVRTPDDQHQIDLTADDADALLTQVLRHHGLPLNTRCGDRGLCEGCTVALAAGKLRNGATGSTVPGSRQTVRACQHQLIANQSVTLEVPQRSLAKFTAHVVDDFAVDLPHALNPIRGGLAGGDPAIGAAIDIGTTTVAVMLVDLRSGDMLARAGAFNRQVDHGDNVLTRINLCMADATNIGLLQDAVLNQTIAPLLAQACEAAGVGTESIACLSVAGNTTMLHLLVGEDPSSMGIAPFMPSFTQHRAINLRDTPFRGPNAKGDAPGAELHLLPSAAAYIGADITAGVVASGMRYQPGTSLLIDVGTNGEIVLCHDGKLIGCATAAGPAFEGGGLSDGVRAGDGAIGHLCIDEAARRINFDVIGEGKPIGLCGSAYIDLLAEGRRAGWISATGRLDRTMHGRDEKHPLLDTAAANVGLIVAHGSGRRPIVVRESDIAALLQAKAAIAAGVLTLLEIAELTPDAVDRVYLAGGFGRHVNVEHAIACGLLPGFRREQIELKGNLSLAGAYLALLDATLLTEMADVATSLDVVELNNQPSFESHFIEQLTLPG